MNIKNAISFVIVVTLALATAAHSNSSSNQELVEEVLVLAQKKGTGESIQDVPIAVTQFSGEQIETMHAVTLTDVGTVTANANLIDIGTFPGVANFVIRGMGTVGQSIPSADPAVGVVIDGVPLGTIYGSLTEFFDLESIEILKGPQGTLFGRNATGGAISIRTTQPADTFSGQFKLGVGNYSRSNHSMALTGPINDHWSGKLAALYSEHDEYYRAPNLASGRIGAKQTNVVRPAISFSNDTFTATAILERGEVAGDGLANNAFALDGERFSDPYQRRVSSQGLHTYSQLEWSQLTWLANTDIHGGNLEAIVGFRHLQQSGNGDMDGIQARRFHFLDVGLDQQQSSLELRWSGEISGRWHLTAGIYLFDQDYEYHERRVAESISLDARGASFIEHNNQGFFTQSEFTLNQDLTLTLGARVTQERKSAAIGVIGDPNASGSCANQNPIEPDTIPAINFSDCDQIYEDTNDWSNVSPKIVLDWQLAEHTLLYASFSRGFRSGGYNVRYTDTSLITDPSGPSTSPGPYNEESVDALELGQKTALFDNKLLFNSALFHNEFDDLQRTTTSPGGRQQIQNAARATIRGIELDLTLAPVDNVLITAAIGYLDAGYDSFPAIKALASIPVKDLQLVLVPELSYALSLQHQMNISDSARILSRVSYSFNDSVTSNDANTVTARGYELVNASVTYTNQNGFAVSLFGKNIFDEVYYNIGTNIFGSQNFFLTPPRTYGMDIRYRF